jgi:hypothetical protein
MGTRIRAFQKHAPALHDFLVCMRLDNSDFGNPVRGLDAGMEDSLLAQRPAPPKS